MNYSKLLLVTTALILIGFNSHSQVGIGTNNPVAGSSLHIEGGDSGILINRVSLSGTNDVATISSLSTLQEGLMVYNTNASTNVNHQTDVYPGFYFWTGTQWQAISKQSGNRNGWGFFVDGTYISEATGLDITKDIRTKLENDASSSLTNITEINDIGLNIWNNTHDAINPKHIGDGYDIRVTFKSITSAGGTGNYVNLELDIGAGGIGTGPVIWQESKPMLKGASVITPFSFSIPVFALPPFYSTDYSSGQGGIFYITSNVDISIWDIRIFIVRTYTN
jgi:hypothetical protein